MHLSKVWFSFSGRITRRTWWLAIVLPSYALVIFAGSVDFFLGTYDAAGGAGIFQLIAWLAVLWPILAGHAKRCHDRGKTAWFILINLIPLVGAIWFFVELGFLAGTVGDNRFGPDPKMIAAPAPAGAPGWPAPGPVGSDGATHAWEPGENDSGDHAAAG